VTDGSATVTWAGHASVLIEASGHRLLTDPTSTGRLAHLRRRVPVPDLGPVDTVLISHLHLDHLHLPSLRRLGAMRRLIVPTGAAPLLSSVVADEVHEVRPGDAVDFGGVTVRAVPADHPCRRGPHSRASAEPVGYVIEGAGTTVYFAGDTDLFDGMRDLGAVDVALLPIWGWGPALGGGHLDPERAAAATAWIDPGVVVPIHWGTYSPVRARPGPPAWLDRPLDAFRAALAERSLTDRLRALAPGGSVDVAPRAPGRRSQ
jgi:L-ascorbate metabolism protein UlaG (beta-lactamase superfamily)